MENNDWPDRPGVPPKDGPYWLQCKNAGDMQPCNYEKGKWFCIGTALSLSVERVAVFYNYLGPCLTLEEIARREDTKWHEGYAAGVSDIRRGVAFGEPDTHYTAKAARIAELEAALKDASASVKEWGAYASAYLQEKWDLPGEVARYIAIAEGKEDE